MNIHDRKSHLLQMRGLKPFLGDNHLGIDQVASFTDAWIETLTLIWYISPRLVASFTDAWIETNWQNDSDTNFLVASFTDAWIETGHTVTTVNTAMSHLLQMRGLKRLMMPVIRLLLLVASFTDAWIET